MAREVERQLILGGRFRLEESLAGDPLVEVWRATDTELRRDVVIKLLRSRWTAEERLVDRFRSEALTAAQLTHDHIASTFDVEFDGELLYTVSEFVDGPTLTGLLANGPLDPPSAAALGRQVALGLAAAHELGVVHRAVCPANIVAASDGRVCLVDFGSVRFRGLDEQVPDPVFGEPDVTPYWSPEQKRGGVETDRADVYSLAVVLWEALTGRPEIGGDTPGPSTATRLRSWLPGADDTTSRLVELLTAATAMEPTQRPSARRLADELTGVCGTRPQEHVVPLVAAFHTADRSG